MDGSRFDEMTRALAACTSRRGLLKDLAAGLLVGTGGRLGAGRTAAQGCVSLNRRCATDTECCSGLCDPTSGRCVCGAGTEACGRDCLPLDHYQSDVENCGACQVRCRRAPECQLPACLAGVCGGEPDPALVGQPCGRDGGVCGADGICACPPELPTACPRGCADTASDPRNCGVCDNRCLGTENGSAVCTGGVCGIACDAGYVPCGDGCCAADRECCDGECCGPNQCCAAEGCVPCRCEIGIESYDAGEVNPDHACQYCDPTRDRDDWTIAADGTFCGEGRVCCNGECCSPSECCDGVQCSAAACPDQCEILGQPVEAGEVNEANACQVCDPDQNRFDWTLVADQTACSGVPGRVCCNGECCSPTECCGATSCEECGPHCRIGDEDIDEGAVNPANECEICNPEASFGGWSPAPDDTDCGTGQVCCAGQCCPFGECCHEGTCGTCRCEIGVDVFDRDAVNPFNACQICNPDADRDDWSPGLNNAACGLTDDRFCCAGDCCPAGECCNAIGECEPCGCVISGEPVLEGAVNPADTCQACLPNRDRRDWTVRDDDAPCGDDADDRVCCGGVCCAQGECCDGGSCQACGCEIGGDPIDPETINPANVCQVCDPSRARLDWSPVDNGAPCGAGDAQRCCGGECCAEDECCLLDACGECLCAIGNDTFPPDAPHPTDPCQVCDPDRDPFDWSTAPDDTSCGEHQVCCAGACCGVGECCTESGTCLACRCVIGDATHEAGVSNPANGCEVCDPPVSTTAWSPAVDESPCAADFGRVCCSGGCCPPGECCTAGVCGPCRCTIGEREFIDGDVNPENGCEVCTPALDAGGWSLAPDNAPCGDNSDLVCCRGVCCTDGNCCHSLEETCGPGPCRCTIGEVEVAEGEANPANACERCDPAADPADWTPLPDDSTCGEDQVCCLGTCCAPGDCCTLGVCGLCGCQIAGQGFADGEVNPANACQVCDPVLDPFAWSPVADDSPCGENGDQVCCTGVCCRPRWCCNPNGNCDIEFCGLIDPCENLDPCGCTIGGQFFANFALNPGNECQHCNVAESTTDWSANGFAGCGATGQQFCNGHGGCCALGICPDLNAPGFCGDFCDGVCVIGGILHHVGDLLPGNDCQVCSPLFSHTSWTTICRSDCCASLPCDHCL